MSSGHNISKEEIVKLASQVYEYFERDYTNFTNSRLRSVKYCDSKIKLATTETEKLIWLDIKTELKNSKL